MSNYFYKLEYKYMYLSILSYSFANALSETFGTVMLYKANIPIYIILLIYSGRFLITGIITPFFITISNKIGIAKCILISNIFSIINSYFMLHSENIQSNIIIFIITIGLMGLSNPSSDALSSKYVNTNHRGQFNSLFTISKIIGAIIATILITYGLVSNTSILVMILITIGFLLQYIFIRRIDYKPESKSNAFKSSFKYIIHSKSKYKYIYAIRTNHIIERLFLPLYLYILLQDIITFSTIIVISLLFQIVTITLIGKYSDKNLKQSNNLVATIKLLITTIFLIAKNKLLISINKAASDNFEKVYETTLYTSLQNIIKQSKEDNELLSAVGQMTLCFTEVIVFIILAILSKFIFKEIDIFYIIFILSIITTIITNILIKIESSKINE